MADSLITPLGKEEQAQLLASAEGRLPFRDTVLLRRLLFEVDQLRKRLGLEPERQFPIIGNSQSLVIPWSVAEKAYEIYCVRFGRQQALETLAQRGGFSALEMDVLLPEWHRLSRHCPYCLGSNGRVSQTCEDCMGSGRVK